MLSSSKLSKRISLRTRWLVLAGLFYFLLVGLLVFSMINIHHSTVEGIFKEQMKSFTRFAVRQLEEEEELEWLANDKECYEEFRASFMSHPDFEYATLQNAQGETQWTIGTLPASDEYVSHGNGKFKGPDHKEVVLELEPSPSGWLHLEGHLFEVSFPLTDKKDREFLLKVGMNTVSINKKVASQLWVLGVVVTVMAMLGVGLVFGMDKSLRKNLNQLISATNALVEDNSRRVQLKTGDEFETLGDSFNTMADRLKTREEELQSVQQTLKLHSRQLEGLIEARTKELVKIQAQLFQSAKLASLGEIVGGVAHEINNPVAIMASRIELLLDESKDTPLSSINEDLKVLLKHSRRIGDITTKLLAFSRMSPQQKKLTALTPVIDEAVGLLESQLAKRSIIIEQKVAENLPDVMIDASQILQVFMNIINNSKDAIDRNGKIHISCMPNHDKGNEWLDVVFDDTGPGIEPAIRDKVFDPFFTTKPIGKGTGLGLSVSYGIVADHGGEIKVSESGGGGARFTVRLPAGNPGDKI